MDTVQSDFLPEDLNTGRPDFALEVLKAKRQALKTEREHMDRLFEQAIKAQWRSSWAGIFCTCILSLGLVQSWLYPGPATWCSAAALLFAGIYAAIMAFKCTGAQRRYEDACVLFSPLMFI